MQQTDVRVRQQIPNWLGAARPYLHPAFRPTSSIMIAQAGKRRGMIGQRTEHLGVRIILFVFPRDKIARDTDQIRFHLQAHAKGSAQIGEADYS